MTLVKSLCTTPHGFRYEITGFCFENKRHLLYIFAPKYYFTFTF